MFSIEKIIEEVIVREGGFTNDPADHGGPTKYGITQVALSEYRQKPVSVQDVMDLTIEETRLIYRNKYLTSVQFHRIHDPYVLTLAFDSGVNHGTHRVIQWLQKIVGVPEDGFFGDVTEVAVNSYEPTRLYQKLLAKRIRFYGEIIAHDPELRKAQDAGYHLQARFAGGWTDRAASFVEV
jgi:lysozyme family protein